MRELFFSDRPNSTSYRCRERTCRLCSCPCNKVQRHYRPIYCGKFHCGMQHSFERLSGKQVLLFRQPWKCYELPKEAFLFVCLFVCFVLFPKTTSFPATSLLAGYLGRLFKQSLDSQRADHFQAGSARIRQVG